MSTINAIKIKQADGTYSSEIPIGTSVGNVQWDSTNSLADILGTVDFSTNGSIQNQINVLSEGLLDYVADYVDPTSNTKTEGVIEGDLANNTAEGQYSHAEGSKTAAYNKGSHAEGQSTSASGSYAHAEGYDTHAAMNHAHAEGSGTAVFAPYAHAEGKDSSIALTAQYSHAQGQNHVVRGKGSHAEGRNNTTGADANYSHVEGWQCTTSAAYSHASGIGSTTTMQAQTVIGKWNSPDLGTFVIGNGTDNDNRSNALVVKSDGDVFFALNTAATSGTTDAKLYAAITALGWENEVITS